MFRSIAILAATALVSAPALALAGSGPPQEKYERKGPREHTYSYDDGHTIVKRERKGREVKREWKRGDDEYKYERKKDGAWKEEIKEGGCKITREMTSSGEYKEDRDC